MKCKVTENGIELVAETTHEREALRKIAGKPLTAEFDDSWEQEGSLLVQFEPHPWDR